MRRHADDASEDDRLIGHDALVASDCEEAIGSYVLDIARSVRCSARSSRVSPLHLPSRTYPRRHRRHARPRERSRPPLHHVVAARPRYRAAHRASPRALPARGARRPLPARQHPHALAPQRRDGAARGRRGVVPDNGYQFLAMTEHNIRIDPAELDTFAAPGFVVIPGEEVTDKWSGTPLHVNALCAKGEIRGGFDFPRADEGLARTSRTSARSAGRRSSTIRTSTGRSRPTTSRAACTGATCSRSGAVTPT